MTFRSPPAASAIDDFGRRSCRRSALRPSGQRPSAPRTILTDDGFRSGTGEADGSPGRPFVVGMNRSGTTLLRMMLDAHPELTIPPETHFVPDLIKTSRARGRRGRPRSRR